MKKKKIIIIMIMVSLAWISASHGETFEVSTNEEIQGALDAASNNGQDDTINIATGRYDLEQPLTYVSAEQFNITIQGAGIDETILAISREDFDAPDMMIIDTTQADDSGSMVIINGLTFLADKNLVIVAGLATVTVENSSFQGYLEGGGLVMQVGVDGTYSEAIVRNCLFKECRADNGGGASISSTSQSLTEVKIINNIFDDNYALNNGGGLWLNVPISYVINNTFLRNRAHRIGGAVYFDCGRNDIFNNLFYQNTARRAGVDIYLNTIGTYTKVYNNSYEELETSPDVGSPEIRNSNSEDSNMNIVSYELHQQSESVNSGDSNAPGLPAIDFRGNRRISDSVVDRGAIEHNSSPPDPPDSDDDSGNAPDDQSGGGQGDDGDSQASQSGGGGGGGGGCFISIIAR